MTISFIIPVYNGERYISACLYSLLKQTYTDWQAILINDGSTDNSLSVLQSFAKSDSRFVVYSQNNQGVAIARNRGIKEAQGEYISFLDIDDTLVSDFLERFICHFEKNVDIVIAGYHVVRKNKKVLKQEANVTLEKIDYLKKVLRGKYGWERWAKVYRRELCDEPMYIPCHLRIGEDATVYMQLVARSCKVKIINEALYNYIQYPSSASHQRSVTLAEETLQAAFYIDHLLKKESFYQEIRDEIDAMYLLFYSNSTRKAFLRLNHPLIYQVYQEHYSLRALKILPLFKSIYISLSLLLRKTLS